LWEKKEFKGKEKGENEEKRKAWEAIIRLARYI